MTKPIEPPNAPPCPYGYPIKQSEERKSSRRAFAKLVGVSFVVAAGGALLKDRLFTPPITGPKKTVATASELPIGAYKLFPYPEHQPCILIRLTESEYVAYSQSCTHLMCPVHFNKESQQLVCPCHQGFFDAKTGKVLAGPPPRPLPRYPVSIESDAIIVG